MIAFLAYDRDGKGPLEPGATLQTEQLTLALERAG